VAKVDGQQVKVGDWVCFKSDIEQCGRIDAILSGNRLVLKPGANGFQGAYIGGLETTIERAEDCWIE
jgi:hypothetical protein